MWDFLVLLQRPDQEVSTAGHMKLPYLTPRTLPLCYLFYLLLSALFCNVVWSLCLDLKRHLIQVHGRRREVGSFFSEEEAARCYDRHAVLAWGVRFDPHIYYYSCNLVSWWRLFSIVLFLHLRSL